MSDDIQYLDPQSQEFSDLLTQWDEAKKVAAEATAKENALRKRIFGEAFPTPQPDKNNKVRLPFGMALVGEYKLNYKIDEAAMNASRPLIEPALFDEVIAYRPSVRNAAFRDLTPEQRQPFTGFITVSPGMPGLEIKPADKIRWK